MVFKLGPHLLFFTYDFHRERLIIAIFIFMLFYLIIVSGVISLERKNELYRHMQAFVHRLTVIGILLSAFISVLRANFFEIARAALR
jgi:hypothetical protein